MKLLTYRVIAIFIDMNLVGIITAPIALVAAFLDADFILKFTVVSSFLLFFLKDLYSKRGSYGKLKMNLCLHVKSSAGRSEQELKYFKVLRNVTLILWPLEVFVALVNNGKRIGDLLGNSRVDFLSLEKEGFLH
ncbi:MAG: hypothetical protein MK226_12530 [Saprospiraceae bacterium]|nr:hypothetical protein [Saprospiraceae bacterium]